MKPISVGIFLAFFYSYSLWAIAKAYDLNHDPIEAGVIKSTAYTLLFSLPIGMAAHAIVAFFHWSILLMIPISFGIAVIAASLLSAFNSTDGQLVNILAFLGMPVAFSIPYSLILNKKAKSGRREVLTPAPHTTGHTDLPSGSAE